MPPVDQSLQATNRTEALGRRWRRARYLTPHSAITYVTLQGVLGTLAGHRFGGRSTSTPVARSSVSSIRIVASRPSCGTRAFDSLRQFMADEGKHWSNLVHHERDCPQGLAVVEAVDQAA